MIFDGRVAFQCEDPKCIHRTKLDASLVKEGAYLTSFGFFFPDHFPASFHYDGTRSEGGIQYDVIKVSPAGLQPVDLWLNRQTHRIARFVTAGGLQTDLSDYRSVDGVTVPFVSISEGVTVTSEVVRFERRSSASLASFALP